MLNERKVAKQEQRWQKEKALIERQEKIKAEKQAVANSSKKLSTSKRLIWFLFVNCTIIELFTGYVTVESIFLSRLTGIAPDFTPLITLIGAVVGEVIGLAIYSIKAKAENTQGGIEYERAMLELQQQQQDPPEG